MQAGVKDLREAVAEAAAHRDQRGERTVLFIDEIHRFNKAQQDALLPHVEAGTVMLIGATTENPSFEVNAALLSRAKVVRLERAREADLRARPRSRARRRASAASARSRSTSPDEVRDLVAREARGDARRALRRSRRPPRSPRRTRRAQRRSTAAVSRRRCRSKTLLYDKAGDEHYGVVSALHQEHARLAIPTPRSTG